MSEALGCGYVVESSPLRREDPNKRYIGQIIKYIEYVNGLIPALVEGEELRGKYQKDYEVILNLFRQIDTKYNELPEYIEIDFDVEDVKEPLRNIFSEAYEKSIRETLSAVFPEKLAEVNVPEFCQTGEYDIPDVKRWQHVNSISPEFADSEYMRFIAEAREVVVDNLTEESGYTLPDDFVISGPEYIPGNNDKLKLSKLLENFMHCKIKEAEAEDGNVVNPDDDLRFAKKILTFIESIKLPSEEELAKKYKEVTIKGNIPAVRELAEFVAKEHLSKALDDVLKMLSEKLNGYEAAPEPAVESLKKPTPRKKRKKPQQNNPEVNEQNPQTVEVDLRVGQYIELDKGTFPWLDEETVEVLYIKTGNDGNTVVVDARTETARKIEYRMPGYDTRRKRQKILPKLYRKLKLAAKLVSTSDSGLRGSWATLSHRDKNKYPFNIFSWKPQSPDAPRMYVSHITVDMLTDESARAMLKEHGVSHLLMLLGACDKNNQEKLLPVFTGRTSRVESADGAGV